MKNNIGWCDETLNVIVGCTKCSPGCLNCYAEAMAVRLAGMGQEKYKKVTGMLYGGRNGWNKEVEIDESALQKPFTWKKPRTIFINSMGDTFHESVPFDWVDRVMDVIHDCRRHKFMLLTKRAEEMAEYMKKAEARLLGKWKARTFVDGTVNEPVWPLPNLALGVTAENQETADLRIPILLQIPAALRFVSIEPMLGAVDISRHIGIGLDRYCAKKNYKRNGRWGTCGDCWKGPGVDAFPENCINTKRYDHNLKKTWLDWVILGMETGHGARTFPGAAEAIVNIKDQCQEAGVPFFYKGPSDVNIIGENINGPTLYRISGWHEKNKNPDIVGVEYRQRPAGW